jgi:hypothetical protein
MQSNNNQLEIDGAADVSSVCFVEKKYKENVKLIYPISYNVF